MKISYLSFITHLEKYFFKHIIDHVIYFKYLKRKMFWEKLMSLNTTINKEWVLYVVSCCESYYPLIKYDVKYH